MRDRTSCCIKHFSIVVCIVSLLHSIASGADLGADVHQWIEQLRSPQYVDRSDAMWKLRGLGVSALDALERTTRQQDPDVSRRALEVLKLHFLGDDSTLSHEAGKVLQRIADDPTHRKSKIAKKILRPEPKPITQGAPAPMAFPAMQIRINGAIQIRGGGGKKELSIDENGKKFRFVEDKNGIKVESPDGKGGIRKATYKDAQELKKKDPNAYRKYDNFFGGRNGIRIQIGGAAKPAAPKKP